MSETETSNQSPPDEGLPLSFEAWADLSARMLSLKQEERFDILDERDVDPEDWQRCDRHYSLALADDIVQERMERAHVYGRKCAAEIERRKKPAAPPEPEAERAFLVVERDATPEAPGPVEPARVEASHVPSYLQPHASIAPAASPLGPPASRPPADLAGTAMAFELPTALRPKAAAALPFQSGAAPALAPGTARPPPPAPAAGETIGLGVDLIAQMGGTLPFPKARAAPRVAFPRLPLQNYASFCAELAIFPERTAAILAKYNVSGEEARAALVQEWQARLDAHADTRAEWQKFFDQFCGWLRQQPR